MIFNDPFYQTHQGEIFQSSNCMQHEHAISNLFTSILLNLGYSRINSDNRSWQKGDKKIVVCLADDFGVCRKDFSTPPAEWFDSNTAVITDNYMPLATQYQIYQLPQSYFGIFNYTPADQEYCPAARFHFSANRLDHQRLHLMLEFIKQVGSLEDIVKYDFVNFNGWDPTSPNQTLHDIVQNVCKHWNELTHLHCDYSQYFDQLIDQLPLLNHNLTIEQAHVSSQLNLVIETYAGDASVAFSEKIFRALVTSAPWTLFSAKNAVRYLQTLGFDTIEDLVDHSYDDHPHNHYKIKNYINSSQQVQQHLQTNDATAVKQRCVQAAAHNQQILQQMQQSWPQDFARWLPTVIEQIQ
jgi:hypothetical protein